MTSLPITCEEFVNAAKDFIKISDRIFDGWRLVEKTDLNQCFIKKECFINSPEYENVGLTKVEYVIFYNLGYGVPSLSFNMWDSSGVLFTLEKIRQLSTERINKEDFYSVITQQEHPIFFRPYFIVHPCHTASLLTELRSGSKNIIVTFLGLVTPLLRLNLALEYGV